MSEKPKLIVVAGPTASGKTATAIALANMLQCAILSADSRQFFHEMSIGTAKPNHEEMAQAQHVFIDHLSVVNDYSAGAFERDALHFLAEYYQQNKVAILCGGSGLYIDALCYGMDDLPKNHIIRKQLNDAFDAHGLAPLLQELHSKDAAYYAYCDLQNPRRVIRALEVIRASGKKMSDYQQHAKKARDFDIHYFVLHWQRDLLYNRINQRVDLMIENGLLEEAKVLVPFKDRTALQTVGYQEIFEFLDGKYTLHRAIELIKQNSRRYAKRQTTWFKKNPDAIWLNCQDHQEIAQELAQEMMTHITSNFK